MEMVELVQLVLRGTLQHLLVVAVVQRRVMANQLGKVVLEVEAEVQWLHAQVTQNLQLLVQQERQPRQIQVVDQGVQMELEV